MPSSRYNLLFIAKWEAFHRDLELGMSPDVFERRWSEIKRMLRSGK